MASAGFHIERQDARFDAPGSLKTHLEAYTRPYDDSKHDLLAATNMLNRQFSPSAPNLAYVSDITCIRTDAGWLHLVTVLDLYARKVLGWAMAPSIPAKLVYDALNMAIQQRHPAPGSIVQITPQFHTSLSNYLTLLFYRIAMSV
jgi:putative transposase